MQGQRAFHGVGSVFCEGPLLAPKGAGLLAKGPLQPAPRSWPAHYADRHEDIRAAWPTAASSRFSIAAE